jgi:hypothetical protein
MQWQAVANQIAARIMRFQKPMPKEDTNVGQARTPALSDQSPADEGCSRASRIDEYEFYGLANPEPFGALVAAIQANLFRTARDLEAGAMRPLTSHAGAHGLSVAEPAIKRHLNVVRRIARNAHLEIEARYE